MKKTFLFSFMLCLSLMGSAQNKKDFWQLNDRSGITWTFDNRSHNDQAEYAFPFFPFTGYVYGNEAAINDYLMFAKYINKEYKHIPVSIINEGSEDFSVAGDRGDAAMIGYGAVRYALACRRNGTRWS